MLSLTSRNGKSTNRGWQIRSLAEMVITHSEFCVLFRNIVPSRNHSVAKWWGTRHGHTWVFFRGGGGGGGGGDKD